MSETHPGRHGIGDSLRQTLFFFTLEKTESIRESILLKNSFTLLESESESIPTFLEVHFSESGIQMRIRIQNLNTAREKKL